MDPIIQKSFPGICFNFRWFLIAWIDHRRNKCNLTLEIHNTTLISSYFNGFRMILMVSKTEASDWQRPPNRTLIHHFDWPSLIAPFLSYDFARPFLVRGSTRPF